MFFPPLAELDNTANNDYLYRKYFSGINYPETIVSQLPGEFQLRRFQDICVDAAN